jgi:long-subunit acyl-CoA synthetase (AMP-forming)
VSRPTSELLQTIDDKIVFARYLEHMYQESVFVQQLFITCRAGLPLVAVVVVDSEVLFWWAKANGLEVYLSNERERDRERRSNK